MNHALHAALDLLFTGMTKRSPRIVIRSSCVLPPSDRAPQCRAQAVLDCSLLPFHFAADAPQLRGSVIGKGPIRKNLFTKRLDQWAKVTRQQRCRESSKCGNSVLYPSGGRLISAVQARNIICEVQQIANFFGFKRSPLDAGLVERLNGSKSEPSPGCTPSPRRRRISSTSACWRSNPAAGRWRDLNSESTAFRSGEPNNQREERESGPIRARKRLKSADGDGNRTAPVS